VSRGALLSTAGAPHRKPTRLSLTLLLRLRLHTKTATASSAQTASLCQRAGAPKTNALEGSLIASKATNLATREPEP
jgi:negative regulator of sigma E activity